MIAADWLGAIGSMPATLDFVPMDPVQVSMHAKVSVGLTMGMDSHD